MFGFVMLRVQLVHLHIGNARTALFNYLFARNQGGTFIIRIEDTDQKRNIEGGEESQLHYLKWLGIDWDESIDRRWRIWTISSIRAQ